MSSEAQQHLRAINKARALLAAFQSVEQTMPIQIAATFLAVALHEGMSAREYQDITGVNQSTMSRHLLDLGARDRRKQPGLALIEHRQNPDDYRRNIYTLSVKGRNLLKAVIAVMEE